MKHELEIFANYFQFYIQDGSANYFPDATRIPCQAGNYDVLIADKNLESLSPNGLYGDDSYHVFM